jgi:chemotaxis methyl-accepting protein methylase
MKEALRRVPGLLRLWRLVGRVRHGLVLRFARRRNYTFTQFRRLPTQVDQLAGPVLDAAGVGGNGASLRVLLFGCSSGAEAFSLASALRECRPEAGWEIDCWDIEPDMVALARTATYPARDVVAQRTATPEFVSRTFDVSGDDLVVKAVLRERLRFDVGDVLDEALIARLAPADVVVAQNFLYHLARPDAERAFGHLIRLLKPRGVLAVDGADLDLRTEITARAALVPWPAEIERIHEEARVERGYAWPQIYWGLEPYQPWRPDAVRRYATIFLRAG